MLLLYTVGHTLCGGEEGPAWSGTNMAEKSNFEIGLH